MTNLALWPCKAARPTKQPASQPKASHFLVELTMLCKHAPLETEREERKRESAKMH